MSMRIDAIAERVAPETPLVPDGQEEMRLFMDFMKSMSEKQLEQVEQMISIMKEKSEQQLDSDGNEDSQEEDSQEEDSQEEDSQEGSEE